ncbi:MAG: hypothetical protein NTX82_01335 [Candidatus Parcubacteria bacterium]|nr:hypothetical protein [Candidatus Parcubacteria bacterium]
MIKQNDNSYPIFISTVMKVILNYLRYSQSVWMIIFWAMFLFVFFLSVLSVIISSKPELLTNALTFIIGFFNIRDLHINTVWGKEEILWAYGVISIIIYALASLIKLIFNIKITLNTKQKLLYMSSLIIGLAILMFIFFSIAYLITRDQIYRGYYPMIFIFAIGTLATSLYYLVVSQAINFIIKVIDYNLARNSVSK